MRGPKLQRRLAWCLAAVLVATLSAAQAESEPLVEPSREGAEVFGIDTPIGRVDYRAGRGLRVGDTGFAIGGFATAEAERLEDGSSSGGLDSTNFFLSFDPSPYFHAFAELEVGRLVEVDDENDGPSSDPELHAERLYGDFGSSDRLNLRAGKFQTPFGRWNQAPSEPLVWTTAEPLIIGEVFDEFATGAMLWGAVFPSEGSLAYSVYGQFLDPFDAESDARPADRSAGARLEYASLGGWSVGASYFASKRTEWDWHHLGGADLFWRPEPRLEVTAEALFGEGSFEEGGLGGVFLQGVWELVPSFHAVVRYEHFDPPAGEQPVNLYVLGLAWDPVSFVRFKVDYRIADHLTERSEPGLRSSISLLF